MDTQLLYTVKEIFDTNSFFKEKGVSFFNIPHYQRGYKWEPTNVVKLLNDIYHAHLKDDIFYCVQNITILKKENYYNVIDGQQRLTTFTLILAYLDFKEMVHNKVRFPENSIRQYTNKTLNEWITALDFNFYNSFPNWEGLVERYPAYDLQDIAHIYHVSIAIKKWFEELIAKEGTSYLDSYKTRLLNNVKFIVNEVEGSQSEEKIFANLNSKRIPLDGADLVRAILITRVAKEEAKDEGDLKNIIFVNERRVKLGWELDQIYSWWNDPDKKVFFGRLISIDSEMIGNNILFNKEKNPINYLYLLYAASKNQQQLSLSFIENNEKALILYHEILHLHYTLLDWYNDRKIYHLLGYLFAHGKNIQFDKIWELWQTSGIRNKFIDELKKLIQSIFQRDDELIDFSDMNFDWYNDYHELLVSTLLLMDVIECLKDNKVFLPSAYFKKNLDDIEHIFPQNPRNKRNKEIVDYTKFLIKIGTFDASEVDVKQLEHNLEEEEFKSEFLRLIESKTKEIRSNSIGNLVLLHRSLNRSLGNKVYEQKRSKIISYHNDGHYIQPHTFKVFVRDFMVISKEDEYSDKEFWTQMDIDSNVNYINTEISNFFSI